jgi:outer membrane biosynthesis protein TonB
MGFEDAALAHVRSRKYRPATKDGAPVRVWVSIIVEFKPKR